jgi:small GTP-binding protein
MSDQFILLFQGRPFPVAKEILMLRTNFFKKFPDLFEKSVYVVQTVCSLEDFELFTQFLECITPITITRENIFTFSPLGLEFSFPMLSLACASFDCHSHICSVTVTLKSQEKALTSLGYRLSNDSDRLIPVRKDCFCLSRLLSGQDGRPKIIILGDGATGKTSLVQRWTGDEFRDMESMSIALGTRYVSLVNLVDTPGQMTYRTICMSQAKDASGVFLVYDVTDIESFESLPVWLTEISKVCSIQPVIVLLGNKVDLTNQRRVSKSDAEEFARVNSLIHFETSAIDTTEDGALDALKAMIRSVHEVECRQAAAEIRVISQQRIPRKKLIREHLHVMAFDPSLLCGIWISVAVQTTPQCRNSPGFPSFLEIRHQRLFPWSGDSTRTARMRVTFFRALYLASHLRRFNLNWGMCGRIPISTRRSSWEKSTRSLARGFL